MQMRQP